MINLKGRYIKTKSEEETVALLGIATAQGFVGAGYADPQTDPNLVLRRYFHFHDNMNVTSGSDARYFSSEADFEEFSYSINVHEKREKSVTQADFDNAAAEFFRDVESPAAEHIGIAFSVLERKLFPYTVN